MARKAGPEKLSATTPGEKGTVKLARWVLAARRKRAEFLPEDLLGEPAWDILLSLYVAEHQNRLMNTADLVSEISIPRSTGARILDQLEYENYISRSRKGNTVRRKYINITSDGERKIEEIMTSFGNEIIELFKYD